MRRAVLHADMDAFFAAVEQRDHPELRGKPVVVGGDSSRGVVAAASYEARRFGIRSAMPSAEAKKRCPHAIFVRGRMSAYSAESKRIFEIFRRYTPVVEGISIDEAFLDLTGTERLLGQPLEIAKRLRAEVRAETALAVSCGIAPVKMVAKIASDLAKPDGLLEVREGDVREFLDPLAVGRIWGVGPVARGRLARHGIDTIGDLARADDAVLAAALGSWGLGVAALARGEDPREVEPYREAKSYGEENTFGEDVSSVAVMERAIRAHSEAIARRLRRDGVRGRTVTLKLKLARGLGGGKYPLISRSVTLDTETDDGAEIAVAARHQLDRAALDQAIRLLGVSVSHIESSAPDQLELWDADPASRGRRKRLNRAIDAIHDRFGRAKLARGPGEVERAGLSFQIKRGED